MSQNPSEVFQEYLQGILLSQVTINQANVHCVTIARYVFHPVMSVQQTCVIGYIYFGVRISRALLISGYELILPY